MNVTCTAEVCPIVLNSKCVFYESTTLPYTAIATNDSLQVALQKIEAAIQDIVDAGGGGAVWGAITGTITNQSDLISYLGANYVPISRTLEINGEIFDLSDNRSWSITTTSIGAVPVGGNITLLTNNAGYITTAAANTNYWKLTGTSLFTGTVDIDADGNDFNLTNLVNFGIGFAGLGTIEGPSLYFISPDLQLLNNASPTRAITLDGTGIRFILGSDAVGDMYYSIAGGYAARLAAAATGNALLSGTAPSWGKIGLTTHISGILPVANGGLNLSSISALSIPVANVANTYATVTPGAGNSIRVNAGGTAWEAFTPAAGGFTNGAGVNEMMKSDGNNAVTSGIFSTTNGNIDMGTGLAGAFRTIQMAGSAADVGLNIFAKGAGDILIDTINTGRIGFRSLDANSTVNVQGSTSHTNAFNVEDSSGADLLTVVSDGRVYGKALHNNAGAVTGTTNQYIASGTYTPTLTDQTNIDSSTAFQCQWIRVGNVVTVSGMVGINATSATTFTVLRMSLPIPSTLGALEACAGTHNQSAGTENPGVIYADVAGNLAEFAFTSVSTTELNRLFTFTYLVA